MSLDDQNKQSVEDIQKALFLVALDNPMPKLNDSHRAMASKQFIHGGGSRANSANRWFDKTVQVNITSFYKIPALFLSDLIFNL